MSLQKQVEANLWEGRMSAGKRGGKAIRGKQELALVKVEGDKMVDLDGFEPSTSSMPWKRAPNCATGPRDKV
jgi:hypothetical protein